MPPNPSHVLSFVKSILRGPSGPPTECDNWSDDGEQVASSFISNPQADALFVLAHGHSFIIKQHLHQSSLAFDLLIVLVKQEGLVNENVPFIAQIQVVNIPIPNHGPDNGLSVDYDSYQQLKDLISLAIAPYFEYIVQENSSETPNSSSISAAKKRFNELSLSLKYLKHRLEVPDLLSSVPQNLMDTLQSPDASRDSGIVSDTSVLNDLTKTVNSWIRSIQYVTRISKTSDSGESLHDEAQFWSSLESALTRILEQIKQPEVTNAIEILNAAKRFQVTIAFQNNLGISEKLEETQTYTSLFRDLPIIDLVFNKDNVPSVAQFEDIVVVFFTHMKKWKCPSSFPLRGVIVLVEMILNELAQFLCKLMTNANSTADSENDFSQLYHEDLPRLFSTIDNNVKFMVNVIRELMRKRQEKFMAVKIESALLSKLRDRIENIKTIRHNYSELVYALHKFEGNEKHIEAIALAYNKHIALSSPFDFSTEGISVWKTNHQSYLDVHLRIQDTVRSIINKNFESCKIFTDYYYLFSRLKSRGSTDSSTLMNSYIDEKHKLNILDKAYTDIHNLILFFNVDDYSMTTRPNLCQIIRYEESLRSKLIFYLVNLEKFLGANWKRYSVGSKIESEANAQLKVLDTQVHFTEWAEKASQVLAATKDSDSLLVIDMQPDTDDVGLSVNYDDMKFEKLHETKELIGLGFSVPAKLVIEVERTRVLKPIVQSFTEHIHLLTETIALRKNVPFGMKFGFLMEGHVSEIFSTLKDVMGFTWSSISSEIKLSEVDDSYLGSISSESSNINRINMLQNQIYNFHVQMNFLQKLYIQLVEDLYPQILACSFSKDAVESVIKSIQQAVSGIIRSDLCDLPRFVSLVNEDILEMLCQKCCIELNRLEKLTKTASVNHSDSNTLIGLPSTFHELTFNDTEISISPSLEITKQNLFRFVDETLTIINGQKMLTLRGETKMFSVVDSSLLSSTLSATLSAIDDQHILAKEYFTEWMKIEEQLKMGLNFEDQFKSKSLLDGITSSLADMEDLMQRRKLLTDGNGIKEVGLIKISFVQIQPKLQALIQSSLVDSLNSFRGKIQEIISKVSNDLNSAQISLSGNLDFAGNSPNVLKKVSDVLRFQSMYPEWQKIVQLLFVCQQTLSKLRSTLPENWLYVEQLENQLQNIDSILVKKSEQITTNLESLTLIYKAEYARITEENTQLELEWENKKPISPSLEPPSALAILARFQSSFNHISLQLKPLFELQKILHMSPETSVSVSKIEDELQELKFVWTSLRDLWTMLEMVKKQKWKDVSPRALKQGLENIVAEMKKCPISVRQYSAFETLQGSIKQNLKDFGMISELKSESVKERHLEQVMQITGSKNKKAATLLVGDVIGINLKMHEANIRAILEQAHAEQLVQSSLASIEQEWSMVVFELFSYAGKCRLVKNWKVLYDQCETNLSTLNSIERSSLHNHLERERQDLESRLNDFKSILDVWIEVQRQWIYLDGVFAPHSQIKASLPLEATRLNNISIEFMSLNKRLTSCKTALGILSIKGSLRAMTKISESLNKTVKGLTDYLDRQRHKFARLFFIGNEDFLELLGSGTNVVSINKHIKSMFTGIKSIIIDKDSSCIVGFMSPQGEVINLLTPVSLIKFRDLTSWLQVFENEIKLTLSENICKSVSDVTKLDIHKDASEAINNLLKLYPAQALIVAFQVFFSESLKKAFESNEYKVALDYYDSCINALTALASESVNSLHVSKLRSLLVEVIIYKETLQKMSEAVQSEKSRIFHSQLLYRCDETSKDPLDRLYVVQGRSELKYGFEYQGVTERLAVTPLVTDCFLAMTQAIAQKQGGSPFGPAGTGKTECIKALGQNLGRMVLVFNCDDSFDFRSMGRILLGICQVGCWGCFDEFNRLETRILSTLSSQVENVEYGLRSSELVEISGKKILVNQNTGMFITMNPGYVGRNELPENLKKHFRGFSMDRPDELKIAQVILSSHGFVYSEELANIVIPFFTELKQSVTKQRHYDFGLRALKTVLRRAGYMRKEGLDSADQSELRSFELEIFSSCLDEAVLPQLVDYDCTLFQSLRSKYFGVTPKEKHEEKVFRDLIKRRAISKGLDATEELLKKAKQLHQIQQSHHGFMLVGKSGSGKSLTLNLVLDALEDLDNTRCEKFTIDSKVMSKDKLFGSLDAITRDWNDGLFTKILRGIIADLKGEMSKKTWIVFDGDVDPEWAENLNSLLDDNKILTLPNGERLELPENVKIVFEVTSLEYVTPATVSRCGMVWFDISSVSSSSLWRHELHSVGEALQTSKEFNDYSQDKTWAEITAAALSFNVDTQLDQIGQFASSIYHIMAFNHNYAISSFFTYFHIHCSKLLAVKTELSANLEVFVKKAFFLSFIWGYAGDSDYAGREKLREFLSSIDFFVDLEVPQNITKTKLSLPDFEWTAWSDQVEYVDLEPHEVLDPGIIVPTVDTVIHESLVRDIVNKHSPLIMCGPPGSGKTMTLLKALRDSPDLDATPINFSKDTTPEVLLATLEQHCEYKVSNSGIILTPKINGKWVVVFCDEINLPSVDNYGTQRVVSFMRQLIEHGGFWRSKDLTWVNLHNVQFVGACNDPNDPGRNKLDDRFLRHSTVVMVDYPGPESMKTIYSTFNSAILKCAPEIRSFANDLTDAMLQVYEQTKIRLNSSKMSHYVYSPRELTRWCRGILETVMSVAYRSVPELIRLWYHEGLRLFYDRLVDSDDKVWSKDLFKEVAAKTFPNMDLRSALQEPILYSKWISGEYESVQEDALKRFVKERLRVFSEEESEVDLILFGDMLDHALRIDRVLRQHQGHMILVGPHTSGKSTLTKFVAWMNGLSLVQLRTHAGFTIKEFEVTLRDILLRCAKGEQMCFLIDESNIMETSFIERMNTLLANSEIPGLFEGEDLENLNKVCASESASSGYVFDTDDELNDWFIQQISENLHVVFTMSGLENENNPQINSSPALFNRCVLSWMGDWELGSLSKVCEHFIRDIPADQSNYAVPSSMVPFSNRPLNNLKDSIVDLFTCIHSSKLENQCETYPMQFLDFNRLFVKLHTKCLSELEDNQRHTNAGLDKLRETVFQVSEMKKIMSEKQVHLQKKDDEAKQMLNKMIVQQNEAERKREFSVATQVELEKQEVEINSRRSLAMKELQLAEPAVLEAQRGVQNIKKQHLTEMRSMANPPASIKMAMESVCVLLGYQVSSWRDVQLIVRKDDFIYSIVTFESETHLTPERRKYMETTYLARPDYNYETIDRASKACGPLFLWVTAQLKYSTILEKIGPLREEVDRLEASANRSRAQLIAIAQMIEELASSIETYKTEYSELIRETEKVKTEMTQIEAKVERSMKLIENLTKERKRWQASIENFQSGKQKLVGNAILGAAFAVYCGGLSQGVRESMLQSWKEKLTLYDIKFDSSLAISSLLTSTDEKAAWSKAGLSSDQLFVDNFSIGAWSGVKYIVDPSGGIIDTLQGALLPNKLIVTSFLYSQFVKVVEDALRFGGTVLIQNAEAYDSILDSVIRNEVFRMGGRKTIQFGGKSLVLSDDFKLILFTKDSKSSIPSFLKSRTTVLNFSITRSNIENRILDLSLEHSKPDLFAQKNEIVSLQSVYHVRLLKLRKELLFALNDVKGTILDNDDFIKSLELLETESSEIDEKMAHSESVMVTVDKSRLKHAMVALHVQNVYDIMMSFSKKSAFYNFPLGDIIDIFVEVFENRDPLEPQDLAPALYRRFYTMFSPSLRNLDKVCFELCLVTSFHAVEIGDQYIEIYSGLLKCITQNTLEKDLPGILLRLIPSIKQGDIKQIWESVKENKDDRCVQVLGSFIEKAFISASPSLNEAIGDYTKTLFEASSRDFDFDQWAHYRTSPILFCTSEHYDVSYRMHQSAKAANVDLVEASMGTREGIELADKLIEQGMAKGTWVLIENIQFSTTWLTQLSPRLETKVPHKKFRLFLTCALNSKAIPTGILDLARVLTIETQPPWKSMLRDTFSMLVEDVSDAIQLHLFFILAWFHTTILERLKYTPLGFKHRYDFSESDVTAAAFVLRQVLQDMKKENVVQRQIPWSEIAHRIGGIIYGGKIPDPEDSRFCIDLAVRLFAPESFDGDFILSNNPVAAKAGLKISLPDATTREEYRIWIEEFSCEDTMMMAGLPKEVRGDLKEKEASAIASEALAIIQESVYAK